MVPWLGVSLISALLAVAGAAKTKLKTEMIPWGRGWITVDCTGDLVVRLRSPKLSMKDALQLDVKVVNICQECSHDIPEGSRVVISEDRENLEGVQLSHFSPAAQSLGPISCAHSERLEIELDVKREQTSIAMLPSRLKLSLLDNNGRETPWGRAVINFPFHAYRPVFSTSRPYNYNLLTVGFPGAGKTTWICSVATAFSARDDQKQSKDIAQAKGHNTQSITKYDMSTLLQDKLLGINLWDTWGICEGRSCTHTDFSESFITQLVEGKVPEGYHIKTYDAQEGQVGELKDASPEPMHGVLFFLKPEHVSRPADKELARKYIRKIQDLGYKVVVVLSWLQTTCAANKTHACEYAQRKKVEKALNVHASRIYPFTRGMVDLLSEKDPEVGRYALHILQVAMEKAQDYVAEQRQEHVAEKRQEHVQSEEESKHESADPSAQPVNAIDCLCVLAACLWVLQFFSSQPVSSRIAATPEWRQRDLRLSFRLQLILAGVSIALCREASDLPTTFQIHSQRTCGDASANIGQSPRSSWSLSSPEDACKSVCEGNNNCHFAVLSQSACTLYEDCVQTDNMSDQYILLAKKSLSLPVLGLAALNAIVCLFPHVASLILVIVLLQMANLYYATSWPLTLKFWALSSLVLQFMAYCQLKEEAAKLDKAEREKSLRQKEIERQLWAEVRNRARSLGQRYHDRRWVQLASAVLFLVAIVAGVYNLADSAQAKDSLMGTWNALRLITVHLLGLDLNGLVEGVLFFAALYCVKGPILMSCKKIERQLLAMVQDPQETVVEMMEYLAARVCDLEETMESSYDAPRELRMLADLSQVKRLLWHQMQQLEREGIQQENLDWFQEMDEALNKVAAQVTNRLDSARRLAQASVAGPVGCAAAALSQSGKSADPLPAEDEVLDPDISSHSSRSPVSQ